MKTIEYPIVTFTSLNIPFERDLKMYIKHIHAYIRSGGTYIFFFVMDSVLNKASLTFDKSIARKIESCSYSYFYPIVIVCCISGKKNGC